MNIVRNDKVVLIKEMESIKLVGETFEVANIVDTSVILRDPNSKVAVGAIDICDFEKHFKKPEEVHHWTDWNRLLGGNGSDDIVAYYRTKHNKVQVRLPNGIRSEANCNKGDEFNLFFGIQLAYERCLNKVWKKMEAEYESALNRVRADMIESKNRMKKMINNLYKEIE